MLSEHLLLIYWILFLCETCISLYLSDFLCDSFFRKVLLLVVSFIKFAILFFQIFESFGPVELVQLPTDPETGHCKGFGFVQVGIV